MFTNMKKIIIAVSLLISSSLVLTIISCKKTTTTSPTTVNSNGFPSGTFSGFLFGTPANGRATFYNPPIAFNSSTNLSIGTAAVSAVAMNNSKFGSSSGGTSFVSPSTTTSFSYPPASWDIIGSVSIPSFSYANNDPFPSYTGITQMPGTISRAQNLTLSITGVSNSDQLNVQIVDANSNIQQQFVSSSVSSVTFISDSLKKLSAGSNALIILTFTKYNPQTINGDVFLFATTQFFYTNSLTIN